MYIFNSLWLTFWVLEYSAIWVFLNILNIDFIKNKMNPGYLLNIIAYVYIGIVLYQIIINKRKYTPEFLLKYISMHLIPLFIFNRYFECNTDSIIFTIITVLSYLYFITNKDMNLYEIYLSEKSI